MAGQQNMDASNQEGARILQDLLRKPPKDVAAWALDQVSALQAPGADVNSTPIFKIAGALKATPMEHKQALVANVVKGFGELPPMQKAEFVRVAMSAKDMAGQAEQIEIGRMAQMKHAEAMQRLADLEKRQGGSSGSAAAPQSQEAQSLLGSGDQPPLFVENLLSVFREARFNEMPPGDLREIAQVAQKEAVHVVQPQQLLDVVHELNPQEREQLTEALVEARVVPEDQRGVLEEAVKPGGYADKLGTVFAMANTASEYKWVAVALPAAELLIGLIVGFFSCGVGLVFWLQLDGILALMGAGAIFFSAHTLGPVYEKLREDPVGAVQRWQTVDQSRGFRARFETTIPGVDFDSYHPQGLIGVVAMVVLVLIGAVWAVVGVVELLGTMVFGCSTLTLFFCIVFIGLRFGILVCLFLGLYYVMDEVQKHRSRPMTLGSSALPMADDSSPTDPHYAPARVR